MAFSGMGSKAPTRPVNKVQFSILSHDEIKRISVTKGGITHLEAMEGNSSKQSFIVCVFFVS